MAAARWDLVRGSDHAVVVAQVVPPSRRREGLAERLVEEAEHLWAAERNVCVELGSPSPGAMTTRRSQIRA